MRTHVLCFLLFATITTACGADVAGGNGSLPGGDQTDVTLFLPDGQTDGPGAADVAAVADAGPGDPACPGGAGCVCAENEDCDGSLCIEFADGLRCAPSCVDPCVDAALKCKSITGPGGDVRSVCLPGFLRLCDPCDAPADCVSLGVNEADVICADRGGEEGAFCATACETNAGCPTGYGCVDVNSREAKGGVSLVKKGCVPLATGSLARAPAARARRQRRRARPVRSRTLSRASR